MWIVYKNIKHQLFRYSFIFLILLFMNIFLLSGVLLVYDVQAGIQNAKNKLGADLVVSPYINTQSNTVEDILYNNAIESKYMDIAYVEKLRQLPHVTNVTSRLYLASLEGASCCDSKIQLIAIDLDSDFLLQSFVQTSTLKENEIILGHNFLVDVGDTVHYFGRDFVVREVLEKTNTSYDESGFISLKTANAIMTDDRYCDLFSGTASDSTSMIFINSDNPNVTQNIIFSRYGTELSVYVTDQKLISYTNQINAIKKVIFIADAFVLIISILSVITITTISTQNRKNEFGSMLTIGITKRRIVGIFFSEQAFITIGAMMSSIIIFGFGTIFFKTTFEHYLGCPIGIAPNIVIFIIAGVIFLMNLILTFLSIGIGVGKLCMSEPSELIKESM